jgi:hypothetical protein
MYNNLDIRSQFDTGVQIFEQINQLDQIQALMGDGSADNLNQIDQIIATVEYTMNGNNPAYEQFFNSAVGAQFAKSVQTAVHSLLSSFQITTKNPYDNGAGDYLNMKQSNFTSKGYPNGYGEVDFSGPALSLDNFDPDGHDISSETIGFTIAPVWLPNSDGDLAFDSNYAGWMPSPGKDPYSGKPCANGGEIELGEDVEWGTGYKAPGGDVISGRGGDRCKGLVALMTNQDTGHGDWGSMNISVPVSSFLSYMHITCTNANAFAAFGSLVG